MVVVGRLAAVLAAAPAASADRVRGGPERDCLARRAQAEGIELEACAPSETERPAADRCGEQRGSEVGARASCGSATRVRACQPPGALARLGPGEGARERPAHAGLDSHSTPFPAQPADLRLFLAFGRPDGRP
jgi:hypothetical protein